MCEMHVIQRLNKHEVEKKKKKTVLTNYIWQPYYTKRRCTKVLSRRTNLFVKKKLLLPLKSKQCIIYRPIKQTICNT